ncbi:MAG: hypothetical protein ACK5X3_13895 [Pseudomonadota bacterium]
MNTLKKFLAAHVHRDGSLGELVDACLYDEADAVIRELEAELAAALRGRVHVRIPTDAMEQEFATHYRRGFEAGRKQAEPMMAGLSTRADAERYRHVRYRFDKAKTSAAQRVLDELGLPGDPTEPLDAAVDKARGAP